MSKKILFGILCLMAASLAASAQQVVSVHYVNGRPIETYANVTTPAPVVTQVIVVNPTPAPCVSPELEQRVYSQQVECERRAYAQQEDYNRRLYNQYENAYRYRGNYCQPVYTVCRSSWNSLGGCYDYGRGSSLSLAISGRDFSFGFGIRSSRR